MVSNLSAMMAKMAKDTSTTDFTLISGEFKRPVHSCVLANRSPYFEAVVKRWSQGQKEINVESCDAELMNMVVDFMYGIVGWRDGRGQTRSARGPLGVVKKVADERSQN